MHEGRFLCVRDECGWGRMPSLRPRASAQPLFEVQLGLNCLREGLENKKILLCHQRGSSPDSSNRSPRLPAGLSDGEREEQSYRARGGVQISKVIFNSKPGRLAETDSLLPVWASMLSIPPSGFAAPPVACILPALLFRGHWSGCIHDRAEPRREEDFEWPRKRVTLTRDL